MQLKKRKKNDNSLKQINLPYLQTNIIVIAKLVEIVKLNKQKCVKNVLDSIFLTNSTVFLIFVSFFCMIILCNFRKVCKFGNKGFNERNKYIPYKTNLSS